MRKNAFLCAICGGGRRLACASSSRKPSKPIRVKTGLRGAAPCLPLLVFLGLLWVGGCANEPRHQEDMEAPDASGLRDAQPMSPAASRFLRLGSEALSRSDFAQAFAFADSAAAAAAPELADIPFLRGRIYAGLHRLDKADSAYRAVLAIRPSYPGVWNNLGNTAWLRQEYGESVARYRRELAMAPDPRPWLGMARAYIELGETDSARHAFGEALALDSTFAQAHFGVALLLDDLGDFEGALHSARRALAHAPDNLEYRYHTASYLVKLGRWEEALPPLEAVAQAWPWHQGAHYNLGQTLMRLGRADEAEAMQQYAEELRTLQAQITNQTTASRTYAEDPYAHAGLGALLRQARRYDEAMKAYGVALYLDPGNADFRNNVAVLHLLQGDTLSAIRSFERMAQADAANVHALINLGSLYALSGDSDLARRAWEAALRIEPDNAMARRSLARLAASGP